MRALLQRFDPVGPIRRLVRGSRGDAPRDVGNRVVACPVAEDRVADIERCMHCDRLIVLHVDADGTGTVECDP